MTIEDVKNVLRHLNAEQLGLTVRAVWEELFYRNKRRLFCGHFPANGTDQSLTVVFASGDEWSKKAAQLYQVWYARQIHDASVPSEFEIGNVPWEDAMQSMVDLLDEGQTVTLARMMVPKCQSMLAPKDRQALASSLSAKPQEQKKNAKVVRSSVVRDDSSTKCSNESDSGDKTAT